MLVGGGCALRAASVLPVVESAAVFQCRRSRLRAASSTFSSAIRTLALPARLASFHCALFVVVAVAILLLFRVATEFEVVPATEHLTRNDEFFVGARRGDGRDSTRFVPREEQDMIGVANRRELMRDAENSLPFGPLSDQRCLDSLSSPHTPDRRHYGAKKQNANAQTNVRVWSFHQKIK